MPARPSIKLATRFVENSLLKHNIMNIYRRRLDCVHQRADLSPLWKNLLAPTLLWHHCRRIRIDWREYHCHLVQIERAPSSLLKESYCYPKPQSEIRPCRGRVLIFPQQNQSPVSSSNRSKSLIEEIASFPPTLGIEERNFVRRNGRNDSGTYTFLRAA